MRRDTPKDGAYDDTTFSAGLPALVSDRTPEHEPPPDSGNGDTTGSRAASGAPSAGWAVGDRFSWQEIQQRLLASAAEEIDSSRRELFFSGLTSGFAIVLTLIGHSVGMERFPDNPFLSALLFPVGFVYIILGRYQLFTENTFPPVMLVLTRLASLPLLFRVWVIVLLANVVGAALGAFVVGRFGVLSPEAAEAGVALVAHALETPWWEVFWKALFAGWLVAGVVWLGTAAREATARFLLVFFAFYTIGATGLFHVVTGAAEVAFYATVEASPGLGTLITRVWLPTLLGNTAGGVLVFALVTHAQAPKRFPHIRELSTREVFFSFESVPTGHAADHDLEDGDAPRGRTGQPG